MNWMCSESYSKLLNYIILKNISDFFNDFLFFRDEKTFAADITDPSYKSGQNLMEHYYKEKLRQLAVELRFVKGEANYYKEECDALLISAKISKQEQHRLIEPCSKCPTLTQALDDTRSTFELQMRQLYDQLSNQEDEMKSQQAQLQYLKESSTPNSTDPSPSRENSFKRVSD